MKNVFNLKENGKRLLALVVAILVIVSTLPFVLANAGSNYEPVDFQSTNLLPDGSLEEGSYTSGVAFRKETGNVHSGSLSIYGRGNGKERLFNTLLVSTEKTVTGKTYMLSAWIRGSANVNEAAFLQYSAGSTIIKSDIFNVTTEWQQVTMKISEFPNDVVHTVGVGITANVASGSYVYFDDFSLIEIYPTTDTGNIADGGFESLIYGNEYFINDTKADNARTGVASLRAIANGTEQKYAGFKTATVKCGQDYLLGIWARSDKELTNAAFGFTGNYFDDENNPVNLTFTDEFAVNKEWKYYTTTFTAPAGADTEELNLGLYITANVDEAGIWFDDFTLVEKIDYGLIANGDLENITAIGEFGNFHGFEKQELTNVAHSGEKGILLKQTNGSKIFEINLTQTADPSKIYAFSAYIKASGCGEAGTDIGNLWLQATDSENNNVTGAYYNQYYLNKGDTDGWKRVYVRLGGAAITKLTVYVKNTAELYIDDIAFAEVAPVDTGMVGDGDIERLTEPKQIGNVEDRGGSTVSITTEDAYQGTKSLKIEHQAEDTPCAVIVPFQGKGVKEKAYVISAWIKVVNGTANAAGNASTVWWQLRNGMTTYSQTAILSGSTDGWQYVKIKIYGQDFTGLTLFSINSGTIYYDNISCVEVPVPTRTETGLIPNGDFEAQIPGYMIGGWKGDDTVYFADSTSLRIDGTTERDQYYCKSFNIDDPTAKYRFSVYIKTDSVSVRNAVSMNVGRVKERDPDTGRDDLGWHTTSSYDYKLISTGGTQDWIKYTYVVDGLPEETIRLMCYLRIDACSGTAWFDNWSCVKLETGELTGEMTTTPAAGAIDNYTNVYLEYGNYDVSFKYTLDGTDPKTSDTARLYNDKSGITIAGGKKTIKAYAVPEGYTESDVYTFEFIAPDIVENPSFDNGIWEDASGNWTHNAEGYAEAKGNHNERMLMSSKTFDINSKYNYIFSIKAKGTNLEETAAGAYISLINSKKGDISEMIYNFNDKLITVDSGTTDWKTYTADFKGFEDDYDTAKVTLWYEPNKGAVAFDDILVEVSQATESSFAISGYTSKETNIFFGDPNKEKITLKLALENLTPMKVYNLKVDCDIYDVGTGEQIGQQNYTYDEVSANETLTPEFVMTAATYYGVFSVQVHAYNGVDIDEAADIRVARVAELEGELNDYIGMNLHAAASNNTKDVDYIAAYGSKWICDEFTWSQVEKQKGVYDYTKARYDFVDYAESMGMKIRLNVNISNPLYDGGHLVHTEEGIQALANHLADMARTFKGRIHAYEIAGEYDDKTHYMPAGTASPEIFAKIMKACYTAIKAEDPDALVMHGAASRGNVKWLEAVFEAGGEPYTDAIVSHPYCYYDNSSPYPLVGTWMEDFIELINEWCPGKPIWLTEHGWSTYDGYNNYGSFIEAGYTEKTAAACHIQMYLLCKKYPEIANIMPYQLTDGGADRMYIENYWGLLRNDYTPKAAYGVWPIMSNQLRDITYEKDYITEENFVVFQYKLADGKKVLAIWNHDTDDVDDRAFISTEGFSSDAYGLDSYSNEFDFDTSSSSNAMIVSRVPKFIVASEVPDEVEFTLSGSEDSSQDSNKNNTEELPTFEEIIEYITTEIPVLSEKEEINETTESDDDDSYEKVIVRKRRRRVSNGIPYWIWIIVAAGAVIVVGGTTTAIILIKRKKRNQ